METIRKGESAINKQANTKTPGITYEVPAIKNQSNLLVITDFHLYDKNIGGHYDYSGESLQYLQDLIEQVKLESVDLIVFGGDIFHNLCTNQRFMLNVIGKFRELNELTNNNVYAVKGNHDFTKKDHFSNFDFLAAPEIGLIKCPEFIDINTTRINLFDFKRNPDDKIYMADRPEHVLNNIGIYHDNLVSVNTAWEGGVKLNIGELIEVEKTKLLDNIDLAIVNHIHTPAGLATHKVNGVDKMIWIPGSIGRTQFRKDDQHTEVELPLLKISGDNLEIDKIDFQLLPIAESFRIDKIVKERKRQLDLDEFKDGLENIELEFKSAYDALDLKDLPDNVRQISKDLLTGLSIDTKEYLEIRLTQSGKAKDLIKAKPSNINPNVLKQATPETDNMDKPINDTNGSNQDQGMAIDTDLWDILTD